MTKTLSIILLVASCTSAHRADDNDGGISDADLQCGDEMCTASPPPTCADGDTLRTYTGVCEGDEGAQVCAYPSQEVECGELGCCGDHCCAVSPSNESDFGGLAPTAIDAEALTGTFDTSADCTPTSVLGTCTVTTASVIETCVCRVDTLHIDNLRVVGSRALVLFVQGEVVISGKLDLAGHGAIDGPGAMHVYEPATANGGGAGGTFGTRGGFAQTSSAAVVGTPALIPLLAGMHGMNTSMGSGGGAGGALQITAGDRIRVTGRIDAGGGGGGGGVHAGGGGGGSGGGILLEAPQVIVTGQLLANGGGGGGGGVDSVQSFNGYGGSNASSGVTLNDPARGGDQTGVYCPNDDTNHSGGRGGIGGTGPTTGTAGDSPNSFWCGSTYGGVHGGGGGGGVGRIRINSTSDCQCIGSVLPAATLGSVVIR